MPQTSQPINGSSAAEAAHVHHAALWYACRTRARAEKKVDRYLGRAGYESYLPVLERERQWADRKKRVAFPLFPGYVFVRFPLVQLGGVLCTPGLVNVVKVNGDGGPPSAVREEELDSVRALVDGVNATGVEPHPSDYLVEGQEVEVVEGPFSGMRGVLIEVDGRSMVRVRLSAIRQATSIEIERTWLRGLAA